MAKRKPTQDHPGSLLLPYGGKPWHFEHEKIHGNGFNGAIKHAWHPGVSTIFVPGKGIIHG